MKKREYREDGTWFNTGVRPSRTTARRKEKRIAVEVKKGN